MKKIIVFLVIVLGSVLVLNSAQAVDKKDQQVGEADRQKQVDTSQNTDDQSWRGPGKQATASQSQSAKDILGIPIIDRRGEKVGRIGDIKFDAERGRIFYVTVDLNKSLKGGKKEAAVPIDVLRFQENKALLTIDRDKLNNAPKRENLTSDEDFQRDLQRYYGIAPSWQNGKSTGGQAQDRTETGIGTGAGKMQPAQKH